MCVENSLIPSVSDFLLSVRKTHLKREKTGMQKLIQESERQYLFTELKKVNNVIFLSKYVAKLNSMQNKILLYALSWRFYR